MSKQGGVSAQIGFIYQTMYGILLCLEREDWTSIKMEPSFEEGNEKTDIFLDGSTSVSIQVKYRSSKMTSGEISTHYNSLCAEKNADAYILAVFANVTSPAEELIDQMNLNNREVDLRNIQGDQIFDYVRNMLFRYAYQKGVHYVSDQDLEEVFAKLFMGLQKNVLSDVSYERSAFEEDVLQILKNSSSNYAFRILEKSKEDFFSEEAYARDISPLRMISENIIEKHLLEADALPKVKIKVNSKESDILSVVDYLRTQKGERRHIYLRGESGSGKSTSMFWIWNHYLENQEKYNDILPVYVPMIDIEDSIYTYLKAKWIDVLIKKNESFPSWLSNMLNESGKQLVLMLDGFNELASQGSKGKEFFNKIKGEIVELSNISGIQLIVSSKKANDLRIRFTELDMKPLSRRQILKYFIHNSSMIVPEKDYSSVLSNPFLLEAYLAVYSENKKEYSDLTQISLAKMMHDLMHKNLNEFINNSQDKTFADELSITNADYLIILDVVYPLLAVGYEHIKKDSQGSSVNSESRRYEYEDFEEILRQIKKELNKYKRFMNARPSSYGYPLFIDENGDIIVSITRLQNHTVLVGKQIGILSDTQNTTFDFTWEHEIYRDYFIARGYALYAMANKVKGNETKGTEDFFYFLDQQMNYDYPNDLNRKELADRRSNLLKSQMVIDFLDKYQELLLGKPEDKDSGNTKMEISDKNVEAFKRTIVWKRILRNVSFTYEDIVDIRMVPSAKLCLKYLGDDTETILTDSKYDYDTDAERWAELAYTYSGLGYNFTHNKVPLPFPASTEVDEEKKTNRETMLAYADEAERYINKADQIFNSEIINPVKEDPFVRNNMARCLGNQAALLIRKAALFPGQKEDLLNQAEIKHREALEIREKIKESLEKEVPVDKRNGNAKIKWIKNQISISHNGIGSVNYQNEDYTDAIESHENALMIREELNANDGKKISLENIVGCYLNKIKKQNYTSDDIRTLFNYFVKLTELVVEQELYFNIGQEIDRYNRIKAFREEFRQSDTLKAEKEELEDYIRKSMKIIDKNMEEINKSNLFANV